MAIVRVNKDRYTVDSLYQYDYNQDLVIYGLSLPSIPEIHFANSVVKEALVKQATLDNAGVVRVDIPNEILTYPHNIDVYVGVYEGDAFRVWYSFTIPVKPKKKPAEFITPDDETVHSFNALENQILNIERQNASFKTSITNAWNTFKSNVETTVNSLKTSFNEKVTELTTGFNDLKTSFSTYKNSVDTEVTQLKSDFNEYKGKTDVLESRPVNNNILINSNFANPVNQRGGTSYYDSVIGNPSSYTIDRWKLSSGGELTFVDGGINIKGSSAKEITLWQIIEDSKGFAGKSVTISAKVNGKIYSRTGTLVTESGYLLLENFDDDVGFMYVSYLSSGLYEMNLRVKINQSMTIEWVKFEIGDHATPYVPRLYGEELELCERYYYKMNVYPTTVHSVGSNAIYFVRAIPKMRVSSPTTTLSDCSLTVSGTSQTGFEFKVTYVQATSGYVNLAATKNSHGLSFGNCIVMDGMLTLDAEL